MGEKNNYPRIVSVLYVLVLCTALHWEITIIGVGEIRGRDYCEEEGIIHPPFTSAGEKRIGFL